MSTSVSVSSNELANCFSELALLIPKGSKDLPVGVDLQAGYLSFYYNSGCVYLKRLEVDSTETEHCTMLFYDVSELIIATSKEEVLLTFENDGLHLSNSVADVTFQRGYSTVQYPEFPNSGYRAMLENGWNDNLKAVINMGLDKIYMKSAPITIGADTSVLKYPNTWVRCRTYSLDFKRVIDVDHIRLIVKFNPKEYQLLGTDAIVFRRKESYLMLPCKPANDLQDTDEFFTETLSKLSKPVTVNIAHHVNAVRKLSKICSRPTCNIVVYEEGFKTTIQETGAEMSVSCGKVGRVIGTAQLPVSTWLVFLRALGTENIQLLVGGEILCLRNQSLIILTHVRS